MLYNLYDAITVFPQCSYASNLPVQVTHRLALQAVVDFLLKYFSDKIAATFLFASRMLFMITAGFEDAMQAVFVAVTAYNQVL